MFWWGHRLGVVQVAVGAAAVLVLHMLLLVVTIRCDDVGLPAGVPLSPPSCGGCLVVGHGDGWAGYILQLKKI